MSTQPIIHVVARMGMVRVDLTQGGTAVAGSKINPSRARQLAIDLIVAAHQADLDRILDADGRTLVPFRELIEQSLSSTAIADAVEADQSGEYHGPRGLIAACAAQPPPSPDLDLAVFTAARRLVDAWHSAGTGARVVEPIRELQAALAACDDPAKGTGDG